MLHSTDVMLISAKSSIFKLALSLASASACEMVSDVYIQVGQNHSDSSWLLYTDKMSFCSSPPSAVTYPTWHHREHLYITSQFPQSLMSTNLVYIQVEQSQGSIANGPSIWAHHYLRPRLKCSRKPEAVDNYRKIQKREKTLGQCTACR